MWCLVGGRKEANINFSKNKNRKLSDIPATMTLPVDRYVDVHVTGNELIGVEADEPLRVLRMRGISDSDDDDDDDDDVDDCAIEFEVVEPFQTQSMIQTFASVLDGRDADQTTVWLMIDVNLLKSDKLSVDETILLDSQFTGAEPLQFLGANYTVVQLLLTQGFHVVAAVISGSDLTPKLDLFQYIYVPESGHGHLPPCVAQVLCGNRDGGVSPASALSTTEHSAPPRGRINLLIDNDSSADLVLSASRQRNWSAATRSGDESASGISPSVPVRIDAGERGTTNRRPMSQTDGAQRGPDDGQVTDTIHRGVDDDVDKTSPPAQNQSSLNDVLATAPASVNVPYVVHPMVPGDHPAETYVVKIGNAAGDLAASGPKGCR